jgi:hypothetical protein
MRVPGAPSRTSSREISVISGRAVAAEANASSGVAVAATSGGADAQPASRTTAASAAASPAPELEALVSIFTASPITLASLA